MKLTEITIKSTGLRYYPQVIRFLVHGQYVIVTRELTGKRLGFKRRK